MNILWVEDQKDENDIFDELMRRHGDDVDYAQSVEEAFRFVDQRAYDAVIVDLLVPIGDGPAVEKLTHQAYNGRYVIEYLDTRRSDCRVICLTNFSVASEELGKGIEVIRKSSFLSEFERVLYGRA